MNEIKYTLVFDLLREGFPIWHPIVYYSVAMCLVATIVLVRFRLLLGVDRYRTVSRRSIWIGMLFLLTGCPQKISVWIAPQSNAHELRFEFGKERDEKSRTLVGWFRLTECSGSKLRDQSNGQGKVVWELEAETSASGLTELLYGSSPPGYYVRTLPQPLPPGCYHLSAEHAIMVFNVGSNGQVQEVRQ